MSNFFKTIYSGINSHIASTFSSDVEIYCRHSDTHIYSHDIQTGFCRFSDTTDTGIVLGSGFIDDRGVITYHSIDLLVPSRQVIKYSIIDGHRVRKKKKFFHYHGKLLNDDEIVDIRAKIQANDLI